MVDEIDGGGGSRPVNPGWAELDPNEPWIRVFRRAAERETDGRGGPGQGAPSRTFPPYGSRGRPARRPDTEQEAEVVLSRSAAILVDGNLEDLLRRAAGAMRRLAVTLLAIPARQADGLIRVFQDEAIVWVRQALARYRAYSDRHDHLPIGLAFDDVRISMDPQFGGLDVEVGGVRFRDHFSFRATGVVFDVRGTTAVHEPAPGFFVDAGERGARIAEDIIDKVRTDLPDFGRETDTDGVAVLIRSDMSDYSREQGAGYRLDLDILVPFDPGWSGGAGPRDGPRL